MRLEVKGVADVEVGDIVGGKILSDESGYRFSELLQALTVESRRVSDTGRYVFTWVEGVGDSWPYTNLDQFVLIRTE